MRITEVRVRLVPGVEDRLKAFCSMTFDDEFVVRDIKVIKGTDGYFVAMPSRKMSDHCEVCGVKNHLKARYCNGCGRALRGSRIKQDAKGKAKLHADVAHPINLACRQRIQRQVVTAYEQELEKSRQPGYIPLELDEPDDEVPEVIR
ncbi:MAG: SpoVG family protein [Phycisphaerales bacterium]